MPKHIDAANAGNTIHYMGTYKSMTPATKSKIAKSPKLKTFLLALVDHDPITLEMTLKVVMRKCTRLHKRAIAAKKKVQKRKQIGECAPPTRRAKFARFHMTPSTVPHTAGITAKVNFQCSISIHLKHTNSS